MNMPDLDGGQKGSWERVTKSLQELKCEGAIIRMGEGNRLDVLGAGVSDKGSSCIC